MSPEQEKRRAAEAEQLLQNPYLIEAFAAVRRAAERAFLTAPDSDLAAIRDFRVAIDKAEGVLRGFIASGRLADDIIEKRSRFKEWKDKAARKFG